VLFVNRKAKKDKMPHGDTAERIMRVATRLFATHGYDGVSIKVLSETASVNIAAINYHFGSKEKLYRHIVESFGTKSLDRTLRILKTPSNPDEFRARIEMLLDYCTEIMVDQRDVVRMILRDSELIGDLCGDIYKKTFVRMSEALRIYMAAAKKNRVLGAHVDPDFAADYLNDQMISQFHNRKMRKLISKSGNMADSAYRSRWIQETINMFLNGILRRSMRSERRSKDDGRK